MPNKYEHSTFSIHQPSYVIPQMKVEKASGGNAYLTYGGDNAYPEYLWRIFVGSSQHNAIILKKIDEIMGNGLYSQEAISGVTSFIEKCNNKGESLNDIFGKCALDHEIFGGFALQIIYSKGSTIEDPQIAEIYYTDIRKLRFTPDVDEVRYCRDWTTAQFTKKKTITYKLWNASDPTGNKIFYYSGKMNRDFYPVPEYVGSIPAIETSIEIANFNLNQLRNGFFPSIVVNFPSGEPTEEEKGAIERMLISKFGKTDNTGRMMVNFSNPGEVGVTVTPIQQPDIAERYLALQDTMTQQIFIGHRITNPALFGLMVPGKLGNTSDTAASHAEFQSSFVMPRRRVLLGIFNKLLKSSTNLATADLGLLESDPLTKGFKDEVAIMSQMSQSEIRTLLVKQGYITAVEFPPGEKPILKEDNIDPIDTTDRELIKPPAPDKGGPSPIPGA